MMFHLFISLIFFFAVIRFVAPLRVGRKPKIILALVLLALSQQHLVNRLLFGSLASPELPASVLALQGGMFSTFLLLAVFVLLRDIFALASRLGYKPRQPISDSRPLASGLFILATLLSAIGVWQAIRIPDVRTIEITLRNLPAELDGFRIAHVSDIHASSLFQEGWVRAVVDKTNALQPDLILLTGDIIDGSTDKRERDVEPFRNFQATYGVFACVGNHEYISDFTAWTNAFQALGLHMLLNEHVVINHNGAPLVIAGTTDATALRFGMQPADIKTALAGAPEEAPVILMEHRPGNAKKNAAAGVDLQLSGHTHGGQIRGLRVVSQIVNGGFISGLYDVGGMRLYVNNGAGLWNGFPVRLGCPSEIIEIQLRKEP
jgi:predicted MPP superfamily phosphohydrolase